MIDWEKLNKFSKNEHAGMLLELSNTHQNPRKLPPITIHSKNVIKIMTSKITNWYSLANFETLCEQQCKIHRVCFWLLLIRYVYKNHLCHCEKQSFPCLLWCNIPFYKYISKFSKYDWLWYTNVCMSSGLVPRNRNTGS
jgi:hypothetical protein